MKLHANEQACPLGLGLLYTRQRHRGEKKQTAFLREKKRQGFLHEVKWCVQSISQLIILNLRSDAEYSGKKKIRNASAPYLAACECKCVAALHSMTTLV